MKIFIERGGNLIKEDWDENSQKWVKIPVDFPFRYLMESCELSDGLTLRDIFLFVDKHLDFFNSIVGNWLIDYVNYALRGEKEESSETDDRDGKLTCLNLKDYYYYEEKDGKYSFLKYSHFPQFDADGIDSETGEIIPYSVSFVDIHDLLDLPIKISKTEFHPENYKSPENIFEFTEYSNTLFQIIYAIFWELSFYGGPSDTKKVGQELRDTVKRIKDGTEPLVSLDSRKFNSVEEMLEYFKESDNDFNLDFKGK